MVYMTQQRGAYFFQMRVPRKHRAEFGELIRVQLNTFDREVARILSMSLAAQWLARFSGLQLPAGGVSPAIDHAPSAPLMDPLSERHQACPATASPTTHALHGASLHETRRWHGPPTYSAAAEVRPSTQWGPRRNGIRVPKWTL